MSVEALEFDRGKATANRLRARLSYHNLGSVSGWGYLGVYLYEKRGRLN